MQLCGAMVGGGCVTPAVEGLCNSTCLAASDAERLVAAACGVVNGACADSCLEGLGLAAPSTSTGTSTGTSTTASDFDATVCEQRCDSLHFFACIGASELSGCRGLCRSGSAASVADFNGCATGICQDRSCLDVFEDAND